MDEWDADTMLRVQWFMQRDPRIPKRTRVVVTLLEDGFDGSLAAFQKTIADAVAEVPEEYRASAKVEQDRDYETGRGPLEIGYWRLQTPEEVQEDVRRALDYVRESRAEDEREYRRLSAVFGEKR